MDVRKFCKFWCIYVSVNVNGRMSVPITHKCSVNFCGNKFSVTAIFKLVEFSGLRIALIKYIKPLITLTATCFNATLKELSSMGSCDVINERSFCRNVSVITSGMSVYEEKYPTTRVLTMIQTLSESVLMMIAQIYILLQTFRFSRKYNMSLPRLRAVSTTLRYIFVLFQLMGRPECQAGVHNSNLMADQNCHF